MGLARTQMTTKKLGKRVLEGRNQKFVDGIIRNP